MAATRHVLPAAALVLALAALGPWAHGTYVEQPIFGDERAYSRTVWGWEAGGWILSLFALAAAGLAWQAPERWPSRAGIGVALALCALGLSLILANDGVSMAWVYLTIFAEWRDVSLAWGLLLACGAWVVAALACITWLAPKPASGPALNEAR